MESLGYIGEFIGGLALIASLVYLALQIRQNTASVRLQVEQAIRRDQFDLRRPIIENPDLADLLVRAIADFDSLSPAERIRANMTSANAIEHLQRIFLLREEGLVHWESQEAVLRSYLALEPVRLSTLRTRAGTASGGVGEFAIGRGTERDFAPRSTVEREWMLHNTWCDACGEADLGISSPREYEENGRVYVEGECRRCGQGVRSEVIEKDAG